jgi:hypothetical protein
VELQRFHSTLRNFSPPEPPEQLLMEARAELRASIGARRRKNSFVQNIAGAFAALFTPGVRLAVGGAFMLVIGFSASYFYFRAPLDKSGAAQPVSAQSASFVQEDAHITNVRFIENNSSPVGEVEFTFDAVTPVHIKGSINDDRVQKVLAHAMLNEENPGVRIRSVNALADQPQTTPMTDTVVKNALIKVLDTDPNPGVRKEALKALRQFPFDSRIKAALVHTLINDKNSGIRIAVINTLDSSRTGGQPFDKDILAVLKDKMHNDDNNYIRIRAREALQEVHE